MPTFIEVCAGAGGLGTGFIDAGFVPLLLNDIDKSCCETLKVNHPGVSVLCADMQSVHLDEYKGRVDILMGGVPCQAFSQAGERRGLEDPRGQLILDFNRLVLECEPKVLLVENVKGLITHEQGRTLASVLELFSNGNRYKMHHQVLNANNFGVPQKRERIIIVGVRSDIEQEFTYPTPHTYKPILRDVLLDVPVSPGAKYPEEKRRVFDLVPPGGCWVDLPEDIQKSYMGTSYYSGGGKRGIARRMSMDEPCLTLTTSPCQKQTDRCHPLESRPFTVREYARIQTFPDTYTFVGSVNNQYKQIGNAVPVKLAYAIARQLCQLLLSATPQTS
jgi:DNA (cytosine-5)-methyltransferase 1